MEYLSKWTFTEEEKDKFISALAPELVMLRTKAEISQEDLAALIGVSRQTYGAIERKSRKMSWSTYLSLIMFYDFNQKTHRLLRSIESFAHEIYKLSGDGSASGTDDFEEFLGDGAKSILENLDEQALHSIRTLVMLEYARCTGTPGDVVVKSFDGISFTRPVGPNEEKAAKAIRAIKERANNADKP